MTVEKPKPKQLLRPITTGTNSSMSQSQSLAITCNSLEMREKSRVHGVICFGFAPHWLKNWRESFKPITKHSKHNHVITFDSHLKTALVWLLFVQLPQMNLRYQFSPIFVGLVIDKSEILQDLASFSMNPWLPKFWKRDRDAKLVFSGKKIDY